ncbi:MAG TPA: hypothetical protein PLV52_02675, partial [Candidatus Omnitrophota bacterium]|nr:hypothetical protein [Candidatus Omnitrophota bacterium]
MNSVYLWEGGRLSKLFKGAVCPRWSLDGERIACVMREKGREGDIAILDRRGKLRKEIALGKKAQSVEWLDANTLIYAAQDSSEPEFRKTYVISYDLAGDREKILYATREGGDVYQMNWSRDRARLVLDVRDRLAASQELRRGIVILDVSAKDSSITVYELSVFKPALFHDDATLICHTDRDRAGKVVPNADTGMLAAYDIRSGVWAPIRDALNVQNTRFSRDGRYFYSSEGEGDRSIVIRLFTIKNLSDPLLRISTWNNEPSQPRKDVRPDLFVPGMKTGVFVALPVWIFGERAGGVATDAVEIATQTPTSGTLNRMPAPVSRTLTRPPAETTPASRTLTRMPTEPAPVAEETLPQLNSIGTKPFEKTPMTPEQYAEQLRGTPPSEGQATFEAMQSPLPEKTPMTPEQYAEQLRGTPPGEGQTNFEAMPAEQSQQLTKNPTPSGDIPKTVSGTP